LGEAEQAAVACYGQAQKKSLAPQKKRLAEREACEKANNTTPSSTGIDTESVDTNITRAPPKSTAQALIKAKDKAGETQVTNGAKKDAPKVKTEALDTSDDEDGDVPYSIAVKDCGINAANGMYTLIGFLNDAPRYSNTGFDSSYYVIQRETVLMNNKPEKRWLMLGHVAGTSLGELVCHYTASAVGTSNELPPLYRWKVANGVIKPQGREGRVYRTKKTLPSPKLSLVRKLMDSKDKNFTSNLEIVSELVVEDCGIDQINGIYRQNGYNEGRPIYYKANKSNGLPCAKMFQRKYYDSWRDDGYRWYLCVLERNQWLCYYATEDEIDSLPIGGTWQISHRNNGTKSRALPNVRLNTAVSVLGQRQSKRARCD